MAKGKDPIHIKASHKGRFTAKAKKAGMGVQAYAKKVLKKGSGANKTLREEANFAREAKRHWSEKI